MERKRGKCRDCKNIKKAIDRQHFGCVKKHIQSVIEINVDHTGCMGRTPLMYAVTKGYAAGVKLLLKAGASVNAQPNSTVLAQAATLPSDHCVRLLLEAGADVNIRDDYAKRTALMTAVVNDREECVKTLLAAGADVNVSDSEEQTALYKAAERHHSNCVDMLIKEGADVNVKGKTGNTPLLAAVRVTHEKHKLLTESKERASDPEVRNVKKCAALLMEAGADVNIVDSEGFSAFIWASEHGYSECVDFLIKQGVDVNRRVRLGMTGLIRAAENGRIDCVNTLIEAGADVNMADSLSRTPLIAAGISESVRCIKSILRAGALVNQHDNVGNNAITPLAARKASRNCAIVLLYAAGEIIAISPYVQLPNFLQKEKKRMELKHLCRQRIRNHLLDLDRHAHLFGRVSRLGLPSLVTKYLLYDMTLEPSKDDEKQDTFFGFSLYEDTDDDSSRDKDGVAAVVNDDSDDDYIATEEEKDSDDDLSDYDDYGGKYVGNVNNETDQCKTQ